MSEKFSFKFWCFLMVAAAVGALFFLRPSLDLATSAFFYRGGSFYLAHNPLVRLVYRGVPIAATLYGVFIVGACGYLLATRRPALLGLSAKAYLYLILALAIGPGLVVNVGLKDHVGRARPAQIVRFGGTKQFTPAFELSDQVPRNGSFVCGHASVGFYFVALSFLYRRRKRRLIFGAAVLSGALIGLVRIIQGGHFLSDVIFSFVFVYLASYLLYLLMFSREHTTVEMA